MELSGHLGVMENTLFLSLECGDVCRVSILYLFLNQKALSQYLPKTYSLPSKAIVMPCEIPFLYMISKEMFHLYCSYNYTSSQTLFFTLFALNLLMCTPPQNN